jgi:hypothetical protein
MGMTQQFRFWFNYNILLLYYVDAGSKTTPTKVPAKPEKPPKKEQYFFIPPCVYCGWENNTHYCNPWLMKHFRSFEYIYQTAVLSNVLGTTSLPWINQTVFFFFFAFSQKSCDCENILSTIIEYSKSWIAKSNWCGCGGTARYVEQHWYFW